MYTPSDLPKWTLLRAHDKRMKLSTSAPARRWITTSAITILIVTASPDRVWASPTVTPAQVTASIGTTIPPLTYTVFATREGLVGHRTANNHLITERDHFVALPSRRVLNTSDRRRDYQVTVCYDKRGRCATAPVFDIGPWNITDDYWNPAYVRQTWRDLPQGRPQAQAARQSGYNAGFDGFGRGVTNPAGIDLADGLFWDGLAMTSNDWIRVSYLWTGGIVAAVTADTLNIRLQPNTTTQIVRRSYGGYKLVLNCETTGTSTAGTTKWYRLSEGGYVTGSYVDSAGVAPPRC